MQKCVLNVLNVVCVLLRSPEKRGGALQRLAHGSLVTPGIATGTPSRVQLVGFTALHTSRKPPSGGGGEKSSGIPDSSLNVDFMTEFLTPPLGSGELTQKNEAVPLEGLSNSGAEPIESSDLVQPHREPASVELCAVASSRTIEPETRYQGEDEMGLKSAMIAISLVPRPHPLTRRNGLVNQVEFLGLAHAFATM